VAARSGRTDPELTDLRIRYPEPGRVEVISRTLFDDPAGPLCRGFVSRLFSVREVEALVIGREGAEIRYAAERSALPRLVRRIAAALGRSKGQAPRADLLYLSAPAGGRLSVRRYGSILSTWELRHALPGRFRLRHPRLRRRRGIADAVLDELATIPGVLECKVGLYTGTLLVVHDPRRIGREALLLVCEAALHKGETQGIAGPSLAKFGVGGALFGLAITGHFVYTPLLAACAALLVVANVDTFRRAVKALRAGSTDTDVVYSTLILLTVLSGDFLSIALMAWSVAAWPLFLDRRLSTTRRALAGDRRRFASLVRVRRGGVDLMTPAAALKPGDVALVDAGTIVPADGVVVEGTAVVDERRISGVPDVAEKSPGQPVYAGARVVSGHLVVEITRAEHEAVTAEVRRRLIENARVEPVSATPGATLARRAAPPVLALSAVGAVTGGLGTAIAILAPNYSAAPGLATPLERSATLMTGAADGFLVRDEAALGRLAQARAIVVEADASDPEVDALVHGLRARGVERPLLIAPGATDTRRMLRRLRRHGDTVAFVGSGDRKIAGEADVIVALGGAGLPPADLADIVLIEPRLSRTLDLLDLARFHVRESRLSRHLGLWPNLVAVGGAFVLGFASLHCTLLTNLGALAVYWRGNRRLSAAEASWRDRRP
jgi:Cu2+-exporting ATPase